MSTPVASDDDSFIDGDYDPYSDVGPRYPVHDAVEFQTADILRNLIFVPRHSHNGVDSDSSDDSSSNGVGYTSDESSGTDGERDTAAAAEAATGIPAAASVPADTAEENENETKTEMKSNDGAGVCADTDARTPVETIAAIGDASMEVVEPNDGSNSSPEKSKNTDESLQDISPVKLDSQMSEEIVSEVKELASQLGMAIKRPEINELNGRNDANDDLVAKKTSKKSKKKKRRKKEIQDSYYCPHDIDLRDPDGNTPLHVAIHARKLEHAKLILEAGAQPDSKCDHCAPIHTAIAIGSITAYKHFSFDAVELLCKHGADLAIRDDSNHTPLYLATMHNVPSVAGSILNDPIGVQTLNIKSDRTGGRPLHAAAKFDTSKGKLLGKSTGNGIRSPDGGVASKAIMTQMLLNAPGIEVDAINNYSQSPLHIAASRGNWQVVRLLLTAGADSQLKDRRGLTPGLLALKKGMPIPNELTATLCPSCILPAPLEMKMPPKRDLIIDPEAQTFLICHELCSQHLTCPPITRNAVEPPPENIRRLSVLLDKDVGILRGAEFDGAKWEGACRRAAMADVLKVHEYKYVEHISQLCSEIPDHPNAIAHLDSDTGLSRWSFEAAMRAAGSICEAVDRVLAGDFRNAFCAVRPPGHHSGPRGIVKCEKDPEGSHGFCLLNNVAIGAAYARSMYRNDGIKKVAIIDFDVHHGNGTEAVVRNLVPSVSKATIRLPFAVGTMETPCYRPWLDETDVNNVFFASAHGYGPRQLVHPMGPHPGMFYPSSGQTYTSQNVRSPNSAEAPSVEDFIFSQSWTRLGEDARMNCCKVINVGLNLPMPGETPGIQRVETRDAYRKNILPNLLEFNPDIIFISAGFDAHKRDEMNFGYVGMVEEDYEWVTEQLVKVANVCCNGRVVSVLEGGYRIHGGIVSPFAKSVASHVRGLMDGGNSRELYDQAEADWESHFEREMVEERERKRQLRIQRFSRPYSNAGRRHQEASPPASAAKQQDSLALGAETMSVSTSNDMDALMQMPIGGHDSEDAPTNVEMNMSSKNEMKVEGETPDNENYNDAFSSSANEGRPTKRKRNQVDYKELFERMKKEGLV